MKQLLMILPRAKFPVIDIHSHQPDEYPFYWRVFETNDEYFDYYRDYHAFWKLYGIGLPDPVLKKLYYGNALKLTPGLSHAGLTN
jgi:hypothetical protein